MTFRKLFSRIPYQLPSVRQCARACLHASASDPVLQEQVRKEQSQKLQARPRAEVR
jgi:hypothetical protein